MISAYEHGWNAARLGKHICPFDSGTAEWQEWRDGFLLPAGQCMQEASPIGRGAPRTADDSVVDTDEMMMPPGFTSGIRYPCVAPPTVSITASTVPVKSERRGDATSIT